MIELADLWRTYEVGGQPLHALRGVGPPHPVAHPITNPISRYLHIS